ncbi:MAG: DUF3048 domain-containing protein [Oscillospiraceae bacterium]|nr:DUF3048 domain-containing protein [Oscillospiraceae bacterium]
MKKRIVLILLAACMVLTLAGCGEKEAPPAAASSPVEEAVTPPPPEPESEEPEPVPDPEPVPGGTNPLTGLPMEEAYENDRPVAIMLNNLKTAQPQLGVSQADIIYEIPAEGDITRMVGVFQSLEGVGTLGSVRSARPYYLEVALGHDALYVHAGGSPAAYEDIAAWGVANMDGVNGGSDAKIFWRDANRKSSMGYEHSLVTSGEKITEYLEKGTYRRTHKDGFSYPQTFVENGTPAGGTSAEHIKLAFTRYKTGLFDYDAESGLYMVSQYGSPYTDGNTGEQVGVTNVLVLETAISKIPGDTEGRLKVQMTGSGKGTFFCGGKGVEIQWSKADRNSPFVYTLSDGTPLSLGQGTSYVCITTPKTSSLSIT